MTRIMGFPDILIPNNIKTISFDIFDTLLVRPYVSPKDLFKHAESIADAPGFADERIDAEVRIRDRNKETTGSREATLDQIYSEIRPEFRHLKDLELELEQNSVPYRPIAELLRKALEAGKNIILVSDMYLPSSFLGELLKSRGINGYSKIYVSCEHSASKRTGSLFTEILKDLNISPNQIMHIGDNRHSDGTVPKKLGIESIIIPPLSELYFSSHKAERRYYRKDPNLSRSIITAMDAIHWMNTGFENENGWKQISRRFGGPTVYDYCHFIHDVSDDEPLLFVARDGYNLQRVYRTLYGDSQRSSYIYAPRIANLLAGDDFSIYTDCKQTLVSKLFPAETDGMDNSGLCEFFDRNEEDIMERRHVIREGLKHRFREAAGDERNITLVDVTTLKYSSQRLISELLNDRNIRGIYYFILDDRSDLTHAGYTTRTKLLKIGDNVNITEFFMTSPEPPIDMISDNGDPIFKKVSDDEKMRLDIYGDVTAGEIQYAEDLRTMFKENLPLFGHKDVSAWVNTLVYHSDRNIREMLTDMKWPVDANHEKYVSMVFHPRDTLYHLKKDILDLGWFVLTRIRGQHR